MLTMPLRFEIPKEESHFTLENEYSIKEPSRLLRKSLMHIQHTIVMKQQMITSNNLKARVWINGEHYFLWVLLEVVETRKKLYIFSSVEFLLALLSG
jgi:hypothetical protein